MANVKRRLRAPKDKTKKTTDFRSKKGRRSVRAVIEFRDDNPIPDPGVVKKRQTKSNMLYLTPAKKVKYLLQNGHLLKDKFDIKSVNTGKTRLAKTVQPDPEPSAILNNTNNKSRRCKNSKYIVKVDVDIVSCDFDTQGKEVTNNSVSSPGKGVNNNNVTGLTNQNSKGINKRKSLDQNKKNNSAVVPVLPVFTNVSSVSNESDISKQQSVIQHFTDKSLLPAHSRGKRRLRKNSKKIQKQPKQIPLTNRVILTLPIFECDYCGKIFNRKHSLVRHIYLHLGRKPYSCQVCPKKFRLHANMKSHMDRDHCVNIVDETTETYSCEICDKPFLTQESLKLHLTSHASGENCFKCIYCDKKFAYQLLLIQHEKQHLVTGKYQCTLCDVKYDSRDKLYVHVKSHLKLTDYICQYCGREFLRANSMKRHIQTAHVGRTIQCPICNKKLKGHLTEHMRIHDKSRPHKCPECGKLFAQSTQLNVHLRGHTGYQPYLCRICDRPFRHSNALMLHFRRHTGEKPFPCAECPLSFSQLPHMKSHMYKIHGKVNPYKCLLCSNYFKLKKELLVHKNTCTGTGIDTDLYGDKKMEGCGDLQDEDGEFQPMESTMSLSRMRFLLALLLTMIASKEKLKYLGFNKRLVDDLLIDSLEAMDQTPCKDENMSPLLRLRTNIETFLKGSVPTEQMERFRKENKSIEELLELLTSEKEKSRKQ